MRIDLDVLRPWSVGRVAAALELHPFEVIRVLVAADALPSDLRLHPADVARVVDAGGLEVWWGPGDAGSQLPEDLIPVVARRLLERGVIDPVWTRSDNVFRGLGPSGQATVRRALNGWIRSGVMGSRMSARGLELTVRAGAVEEFSAVASGAMSVLGLLDDSALGDER